MKKLKSAAFTLAAIASFLCSSAIAAEPFEMAIKKSLTENFSNIPKVDTVKKSEIPGLYEVRLVDGAGVFYTDSTAKYMVQGEILRTKDKVNVTQERSNKLLKGEFKDLDLKDAIKIGNGKRAIAVFEDPNCGYCKKFEKEVEELKDLTVYVFLVPILGPDSMEKSKNIWCSTDPAKAWSDFMIKGVAVPEASCNTSAIERNVAISKKYGVRGTPTIFFTDGTRSPGYMPAQQLDERISAATPKK